MMISDSNLIYLDQPSSWHESIWMFRFAGAMSMVGRYKWLGIDYGYQRSIIIFINTWDGQGAPRTVDTELFQTSPKRKIYCLNITGSPVVRLIFRRDWQIGVEKKIAGPLNWDLSFHLSYR